jgi:hypothetical protein
VNNFQCIYKAKFERDTFQVRAKRIDESKFVLDESRIRFQVSQFACSNPQMTQDLHDLLKYKKHPYITVELLTLTLSDSSVHNADMKINITGRSNIYNFRFSAQSRPTGYLCQGIQPLLLTDFSIQPPQRLWGMVRVNEKVQISFSIKLNFTKAI